MCCRSTDNSEIALWSQQPHNWLLHNLLPSLLSATRFMYEPTIPFFSRVASSVNTSLVKCNPERSRGNVNYETVAD